jgi:acetyl esterase/lipase
MKQVPLPEGAEEHKNIAYYAGPGADEEKHRLDVYSPSGGPGLPVVVFIHGGAWRFGDRDTRFDTYQKLGRKLAARGILTVVPSYRLAPEHKYPAFVKDAARAVKWVQENIDRYGGDPRRLVLMGHSAGAHIAALLAADLRWLKEAGADPARIAGVIGISGPYDIVATQKKMSRMVHSAFGDDHTNRRDASVETHEGKSPLPPFLLAVASRDPESLHQHALELITAIRKAGGQVRRFEAKGRNHFSVIVRLGDADDPLGDAVEAFVKRVSKG